MTDLDKLIEAVERGEHFHFSDVPLPEWLNEDAFVSAFSGSFDAFLALLKELRPGWFWQRPAADWKPDSVAVISPVMQDPGPDDDCAGFPWFVGEHSDPARAGLLALLRSMRET